MLEKRLALFRILDCVISYQSVFERLSQSGDDFFLATPRHEKELLQFRIDFTLRWTSSTRTHVRSCTGTMSRLSLVSDIGSDVNLPLAIFSSLSVFVKRAGPLNHNRLGDHATRTGEFNSENEGTMRSLLKTSYVVLYSHRLWRFPRQKTPRPTHRSGWERRIQIRWHATLFRQSRTTYRDPLAVRTRKSAPLSSRSATAFLKSATLLTA